MSEPALPLLRTLELFDDVRDDGRHLQVTAHVDAGVVLLSVWHGSRCTATFRLPAADAARLAEVLAACATTADADAQGSRGTARTSI